VYNSGVRIKHRLKQDLTDLNKVIALKVDRRLDIQELHPRISLNMVVCLNNKDLNQPDRWLTNSPQANTEANKVVMAVRLNNLQLVTEASRWVTEVLLLQARVDMAVVSLLLMLSGLSQLLSPSEMASKVTKVEP
jgi:hypothetical protein